MANLQSLHEPNSSLKTQQLTYYSKTYSARTYPQTLFIEPIDGGVSDQARVTWRSADGEQAVISVGYQIPQSAFNPFHGSIVVANLRSLNITDYGTLITGGLKVRRRKGRLS